MKETVAAVLVTYNRKELLVKCLDSLLKQSHPLDKIIVLDNASTDGTTELLAEKGFLSSSVIDYVRMPKNIGGAGGFHEGTKKAYENDFDWIWLMDDDVAPLDCCLDDLLKYKSISKCIHPRKFYLNGDSFFWEGYLDERSGFQINFKDRSFPAKEWVPVGYGCFEGMLIHRDIIREIGFPRAMYFMNRDDTEYGYRACAYTTPIYVRDASMIKLLDKRRDPPTALQCYLKFRNEVGYFSRKISRNKLFYTQMAIYHLVRASLIQILILSPFGLFAVWYGFFCGIVEKWGDEKVFFGRRNVLGGHSLKLYRLMYNLYRFCKSY